MIGFFLVSANLAEIIKGVNVIQDGDIVPSSRGARAVVSATSAICQSASDPSMLAWSPYGRAAKATFGLKALCSVQSRRRTFWRALHRVQTLDSHA